MLSLDGFDFLYIRHDVVEQIFEASEGPDNRQSPSLIKITATSSLTRHPTRLCVVKERLDRASLARYVLNVQEQSRRA